MPPTKLKKFCWKYKPKKQKASFKFLKSFRFKIFISHLHAFLMKNFATEFNTLSYIIKNSKKILLFAHSNPDGDTAGSVLALKEYFTSINKDAAIACLDLIPSSLEVLTEQKFEFPENLDLKSYDAIIGCDSVERGFQSALPSLSENDKYRYIEIAASIEHKACISDCSKECFFKFISSAMEIHNA